MGYDQTKKQGQIWSAQWSGQVKVEGSCMPIDPALGTLLGTVVGGALGVVGKFASDWVTIRKDREARQNQRQIEYEKWQREQLRPTLSAAAETVQLYVSKAIRKVKIEEIQDDPELQVLGAKAQSCLISVLAIYPDKSSEVYGKLAEAIDKGLWKAAPAVDDIWPTRQLIVQLARHSAS
jgi:hypothetical protein